MLLLKKKKEKKDGVNEKYEVHYILRVQAFARKTPQVVHKFITTKYTIPYLI